MKDPRLLCMGVSHLSCAAADEPTNHLDIETIDSLARAINGERVLQLELSVAAVHLPACLPT